MVRRCEFVPMDTRENGKLWTKFLVEAKGTRTCGVASSTNASCINPPETVRQFPSTCQLSPAEDTLIIRLPRDSVLSEDHCYTRRGARVDLCIKCGQHLSGSGETARASSNPSPLPSSVRSRLLGMRDQLFFRASDAGDAHLRELVSLQAELILGQQEELLQRKGELDLLSQEKGQLESRIERLERRVSVMQRAQVAPAPPPDIPQRSRVRKAVSAPSRSSPTDNSPLSCGPKKRTHSSSTPLTEQTPPPNATPKRPRHKRERGKSRQAGTLTSHVTGHVTYAGEPCNVDEDEDQLYVFHPSPIMALPPCPGEELSGEGGEVEVSLTAAEQQNGEEPNVNEDGTILTPGWRVRPVPSLSRGALASYQAAEDLQNDVYLRRHRKHEEGERRRKRWDNQRLREEMERENLLKRYRQVHEKKNVKKEESDTKMISFFPPISQVEQIELSDRLPVSAFGCPVPKIKQSVFSLPWYSPESDGQS